MFWNSSQQTRNKDLQIIATNYSPEKDALELQPKETIPLRINNLEFQTSQVMNRAAKDYTDYKYDNAIVKMQSRFEMIKSSSISSQGLFRHKSQSVSIPVHQKYDIKSLQINSYGDKEPKTTKAASGSISNRIKRFKNKQCLHSKGIFIC